MQATRILMSKNWCFVGSQIVCPLAGSSSLFLLPLQWTRRQFCVRHCQQLVCPLDDSHPPNLQLLKVPSDLFSCLNVSPANITLFRIFKGGMHQRCQQEIMPWLLCFQVVSNCSWEKSLSRAAAMSIFGVGSSEHTPTGYPYKVN
jgi:hypothetical protein